jgi:hypothetical protein
MILHSLIINCKKSADEAEAIALFISKINPYTTEK